MRSRLLQSFSFVLMHRQGDNRDVKPCLEEPTAEEQEQLHLACTIHLYAQGDCKWASSEYRRHLHT